MLVASGKLSPEKAEKVKLEFLNTGKPIEQLITEGKLVSESDLTQARAQFYNIPYVS
ncbi:hypothetical protein COU95_00655, partial [Candidatus Shapirobacteria bacterium CG10_big_fil_rev_8_21_14_0_10_40_9]